MVRIGVGGGVGWNAHLWTDVLDGNLVVLVRVFAVEQGIPGRLDIDQELARLVTDNICEDISTTETDSRRGGQ